MRIKAGISAVLSLIMLSCQNQENGNETVEAIENEAEIMTIEDPHSFARPQEAIVKHLNWDAKVNFEEKQITATATWDIEQFEDDAQIIFDTDNLKIDKVQVDGKKTQWSLGNPDPELGRALAIELPKDAKQVSIDYRTGESARALQWLSPEQTAGKNMPFLFTQSQAILARSWVPTQDGPGVRFTYEARVAVPDDMLALMSASNPQERNDSNVYHFEMPQPIPSYLLALAVGDVYFEATGERSGVYAEKELLDTAAYEFADLEKMISAAEELYGPYAWGRYDLIVLPPSFPFGGMENPRLTFATPTILAGDRSLVSLVAHELAHSWSGNLVTNATWNDFWLNEGFTVYFEHRIMEAVYGREYSEMLASLTRDGLQKAAADMMEYAPDDTKLKLALEGRNPDDGVTSIPYDKGYFFLRLIEENVGRERFDDFLRTYFEEKQFEVMTTEAFVEYLKENLLSPEQMDSLKIEEWIYERGIPDNLPEVKSDRFAVVEAAVEQFIEKDDLPTAAISQKWTTHEWLHFIHYLPENINVKQLARLDQAYKFTQTGNSEIAAAWFQPTIRAGYEPIYPRVENFLINVGRRKFLTPTYKALLESGKEKMAEEVYEQARPNYHAVSRETMDELLAS